MLVVSRGLLEATVSSLRHIIRRHKIITLDLVVLWKLSPFLILRWLFKAHLKTKKCTFYATWMSLYVIFTSWQTRFQKEHSSHKLFFISKCWHLRGIWKVWNSEVDLKETAIFFSFFVKLVQLDGPISKSIQPNDRRSKILPKFLPLAVRGNGGREMNYLKN